MSSETWPGWRISVSFLERFWQDRVDGNGRGFLARSHSISYKLKTFLSSAPWLHCLTLHGPLGCRSSTATTVERPASRGSHCGCGRNPTSFGFRSGPCGCCCDYWACRSCHDRIDRAMADA